MEKKVIIATVVLVAAIFVGGSVFRDRFQDTGSKPVSEQGPASGIIYYYRAECPHCQDTLKFLEDNKIAEKVSFGKKEVWHDQANAEEMSAKAKACGLSKDEVGVPFLSADGKCYVGTPDVEGYFREKAGLPAESGSGN